MKKSKRVISIMLTGVLVLGMSGCAGCGDKNVNQGGEGTNFPYTWEEESKGTVLIKLDGSYGPKDYRWTVTSNDEEIVKVQVVKKEKKGVVSYRVTPLAEGAAQVTFTRQREVQGTAEGAEEADVTENEETTGNEIANGGENSASAAEEELEVSDEAMLAEMSEADESLSEEELAEAAEAAGRADVLYAQYMERYQVKDVLSEITFQFDADHSGKKGKLILSHTVASEQEHKGLMQSESEGFDYKLWEDSSGMLQLSLPIAEAGWETSWEGEYIAPEDPDIPGITISEPEKENGRYVILQIVSNGVIDGAQSFYVQGRAQGTATLQFTDKTSKRRLVVEIEISKDDIVSVLSHRMETL